MALVITASYAAYSKLEFDMVNPSLGGDGEALGGVTPASAPEHEENVAGALNVTATSPSQKLHELDENDAKNKLTELEHAEAEWKRERGYFVAEELDAYYSYSVDALLQLGQNGDLKALDVVASKLLKAGKHEAVVGVYAVAALHGSTKAMRNMAALNLAAIRRGDVADEDRLGYFKTMLVHSEVAALRGDREDILSSLQALDFEKVVLSPEDVDEVSRRAQQQFAALVKSREAAGLPAFDNTENPYVAMRMDMWLPLAPNPYGWALDYIVGGEG